MKAKPHKSREARGFQLTLPSTAFGHLVFTDNAGPYTPSMQWRFVMLTVFAGDHSDCIAVYFSREKGLNDSIPIRKRFKADHARFGNVLKYHSDAAQELMGNTMAGHLDNEGAGRTYGVAGVADRDMDNRAERAIYAIAIRARAFRVDAGLPIIHWPLLYLFATFIVNILPIYIVAEKRFTTRLARALGDETYACHTWDISAGLDALYTH